MSHLLKLVLTFTLLICFLLADAQNKPKEYNPFESIGKKGKIVTAYGDRFVEVFDYDSVQRIGSVMFHIYQEKIVRLLNTDSIFKKVSDNSSASRWYSIDPKADKYHEWSPYNFVLNNPIKLTDPDGQEPQWIVGTDGKRVTYATNKDGSITWSKNASADVRMVGNSLAQTEAGREALKSMTDAKHKISLAVDQETLVQEPDGTYRFGITSNTPIIKKDPKTGKETRDFYESKITIYEKALSEFGLGELYTLGNGETVNIKNLTLTDRIGDAATHEAAHATDKGSARATSPNASGEDIEKKPYADQIRYIQEIFKIRNPENNEKQ